MAEEDFELPDIALVVCSVMIPGLDERCGAPVRITGVTEEPEMCLTITCELGHEATGPVSMLFEPADLARPAVYSLSAEDFRRLEEIVNRYWTYISGAAENVDPHVVGSHDQDLYEFADEAPHRLVSREVWLAVRDNWAALDKPVHPDRTSFTSWIPDNFNITDWW